MSEQEFEIRSTHELFGGMARDIGSMAGINNFYKVANDFEEFRARLESNGLGVNCAPVDSYGTFGIITKDGQGLDFPFHFFQDEKDRGVWIADIKQYRDLLGLT